MAEGEATKNGAVVPGKLAVPFDLEQKAAASGMVTEAQRSANQAMRKGVAVMMQKKIDSDLLPERKAQLQAGFEEVRKRAIAARTSGLAPKAVVAPQAQVKKSFFQKLLGS